MDGLLEKIKGMGGQAFDSILQWIATLDWQQLGWVAGLILVVLLFRKPLTNTSIRLLVFIGEAIGVTISETVQTSIRPAVQALLVSLVFFIALEIVGLPQTIADAVGKVLFSIAITAIFAAIYSLTDPLAVLLQPYRTSRTEIQVDWIVRVAKGATVLIGVTAVLKVWGIDLGPALTGMGVLGAGVALAAQDLFKNLIAGMTNMSEKRFQVGDWIRVEGVVEGFVQRVEFRSTLIRRFDMAPVHVPNAELANALLTNYSRMPHRRIYWKIGVLYSTTAEQLETIRSSIEKFILESEDYVPPEGASCYVRVDSFGPSSIDILVYCFTQSATYAEYLVAKERLVLKIKQAVEDAGSAFAYPSRSIYMEAHADSGPGNFQPGTDPAPPQEPHGSYGSQGPGLEEQ